MKQNKLSPARIFDIIMEIIFQIVFLLPWISSGGKTWNTIQYMIRSQQNGGMIDLMLSDFPEVLPASIGIFQAELFLLIIMQVLGLYQLLVSLKKKNNTLITGVILALSTVVFILSSNTPPNTMIMGKFAVLYPTIPICIGGIAFIGSKMMEVWNEANAEAQAAKAAEEAFLEERKRRLYFPGKYSKIFYRVIWKNFLYNWKEYSLFLVSTILTVGLIFSGFGIRSVLIANSTGENFLMGQGLGTILFSFIVVLILLSICLISFILLFYLKSKLKNLGMFLTLGIRRKTLFLYCGLELLSCFVAGILGGLVFGNILVAFFKWLIQLFAKDSLHLGQISFTVYIVTLICVLAVFVLSLAAVHEIYIEMGSYQSKDSAIAKEKVPGFFRIPGMILGVILIVTSLISYNTRAAAEGIYVLCVFFLGLYLLVRHGGYTFLRWKKSKLASYLRNMVAQNSFYHRFGTSSRYIFILAIIHLSALFIFAVPIASNLSAEDVGSMYPYDVVCLASPSDQEFFDDLKTNLNAEVTSYPMVRTTTVDNTEAPDPLMAVVVPQGQHIGISETTYNQLKEQIGETPVDLDLDDKGERIHIVYQQDNGVRSHPLDWYLTRQIPYVRIGQPLDYYEWIDRETLYPPRDIASEETGSIIGSFSQGSYENLVVFSDAYFEEAYNSSPEGATQLALLQIPDESMTAVREKLNDFSKAHAAEEKINAAVRSYYIAEDIIPQRSTERILTAIVNLFLVIMLLVVGMFLVHTKVSAELTSYKAKYRFFELLGMSEKERIKTAKQEVTPFVALPLLLASAFILIFTLLTLHLRQFSVADVLGYFKYAALIYAGYGTVLYLDLKFLQGYILRQVGLK